MKHDCRWIGAQFIVVDAIPQCDRFDVATELTKAFDHTVFTFHGAFSTYDQDPHRINNPQPVTLASPFETGNSNHLPFNCRLDRRFLEQVALPRCSRHPTKNIGKSRVKDLNGNQQLFNGVVTGTTWMSAMQSSREQMGEDKTLPAGASCNVAPNGVVTILDPFGRRSFQLTPTEPKELAEVEQQVAVDIPKPSEPTRTNNGATTALNNVILIRSRDEEPGRSNPLIYRERMYAAPKGIATSKAERIATQRLREFQKS